MKYTQRYKELNALFRLGVDTHLDATDIDIRFFKFNSSILFDDFENEILKTNDKQIEENCSFVYPVFSPAGKGKSDKAILLLHGLNERNWSKYLCWAEQLCKETGKSIILFPIAFHVNRSPESWSNPRDVKQILELRRQRNGEDRMLSFANVSFSERISEQPYRFYSSGRQSLNDLGQLFGTIKQGLHPGFSENAQIDIFAYSIGALLAEITMMTNHQQLFSDSKLFLFCGGGVFSAMFGQSRCIMDKVAYERLFDYYQFHFLSETKQHNLWVEEFESFNCMISPERNRLERELFFARMGTNLKGISLKRDKVMPFYGIVEALGTEVAGLRTEQLDFNFEYTHENPFPVGNDINSSEVDAAFTLIFDKAVAFLS